jgi:organic radical activating enzyme
MKPTETLKVVEIFYSIQGEGANFGKAAIFVRLSDCNMRCWYCDTDWRRGTVMTLKEVKQAIQSYPCKMIIWTGGEPTLQLTDDILSFFDGYYHCIETNGTNKVPSGIDYISCSPKVSTETLRANFQAVDEFRYPIGSGDIPPLLSELPPATNYFVSPIFLGAEQERFDLNSENVNYCIDFVKQHPEWRLSMQMHKLLKIE